MKWNRWLTALLLTSWTLNVALGVAFFLKSKYPTGGYWSDAGMKTHFRGRMGHIPEFPPGLNVQEDLRERMVPLRDERHRLMIQIADEFARDRLDTGQIHSLSDSLHNLSGRVHRLQLECLTRMHDRLPDRARRELAPRMIRRFGRLGMHHPSRHGWQNQGQSNDRRNETP